MEGYNLVVTGYEDIYRSPELNEYSDTELFLWLTHSDMHPDDSFYVEIQQDFTNKTIREVLDYTFPADKNGQADIKNTLEVNEYGELPHLYDSFIELVDLEKAGEIVLDWSINNGPFAVDLNNKAGDHISLSTEIDSGDRYRILHLVIDEYDVPFREYEDPKAVEDDKKEFRGLYLQYNIANYGLENLASSKYSGPVKDALDYCESQNLVTLEKDTSGSGNISVTVTSQGRKLIDELGDECDYYKDKYDIFSNVFVEEDFIDFESEDGIDLRMAAMRYDGLNPYRANMIINLFTGVFDDTFDNWEQEMRSDKFFARYLSAAAVSETELTDEEFENVMTEGKKITGDID